MKIILQSLVLLLTVLSAPTVASATYVQLADGVYQDGTTLYIGSYVTSLGDLQVNPSVIYCYSAIPPACVSNTFTGYGAALHVPSAAMVSYFTTQYWNYFNNIVADAISPQYVILDQSSAELELGGTIALTPTVYPADATPTTVCWLSTNSAVATADNGMVTAVGAGECDIIAACADKQAYCHVTVVPERVTITLDRHEARLLPNHTLKLNATCSPYAVDLAVTSSNPAVALPRLVNGTIMVVGIAEGTATITVNAADGWGNPDQCEVTVYTELGDVNCDGFVNIADVTNLIDYILGNYSAVTNTANADTNRDGMVGIADVTAVIDYILNGGVWPWEEDETFMVNGVTFKMIGVQGGTFTMGATTEQGSDAYDREKPAHEVTLSSYHIGETEVTQALWQAVMGSNPSYFSSRNNYAENLQRSVESVSWADCQSFISKLNQLTGKTFRLPTEAEWEFAARGGNKSQVYKYAGSNTIDDVAWYWDNIPSHLSGTAAFGTQTVATKVPNELGLYDMSGNVFERCQDWYGYYSGEAQTNPTGPASGSYRMCRGGSWLNDARGCRVSVRGSALPTSADYSIGLRLALDVDNSPKFRFSETVVTVLIGDSKTVEILNGDGDYTVEGDTENVTSTINANTLTVTGNNEGTTTVHVTNTTTGATAVLTIIVIVEEENEWVDLGLPSGTLWATCNIGADSPEEYGDYFAWGETEPKDVYDWSTYKWCNGNYDTMTKYCIESYYGYNGFTDGKTELDPEDDAAYVNWGTLWRIPTKEQQDELRTGCNWTWMQHNGVNGYLVIGPNGNSIFLPATGAHSGESLNYAGSWGYYRSRTLDSGDSSNVCVLHFNSGSVSWGSSRRSSGFPVRAVRVLQN